MAPLQRSQEPVLPPKYPEDSYNGRPKFPPKRGPRPARHIPWPEIFKHHISVLEGHLKMVDMVRKHTVEGSGDFRTICDMIDRTKQILHESKTVARTFVPPANHIEQVLLGSSSQSMYPGYSIGEHKYGEAAQRSGDYAAEARRNDEEIKPQGVEYEAGQSTALSSLTLEQMRAKKAARNGNGNRSGSGSGSDSGPANATSMKPSSSRKKVRFSDVSQDASKREGQMFFMDSEPTPVDLLTTLSQSQKRKEPSSDHDSEPTSESVEAKASKKAKKSHTHHSIDMDDVKKDAQAMEGSTKDTSEQAPQEVQIEYEDISAEVDKRMKEKEEKRKHKDSLKGEKKRKRDSEASTAGAVEDTPMMEVEKPNKKKKKSRTSEDAGTGAEVSPNTEPATNGEEAIAANAEKPKEKKAKSSIKSPNVANLDSVTEETKKSPAKKKQKKAKTLGDTTGSKDEIVAKAEPKSSTSPKPSLVEESKESAEGEGSARKKKKARTSKEVNALKEVSGKEKREKRPAEVAEVGEVEGEGEGKKKKQKRKKST
ncbi:MAG: hypothetical protein Q9171_005025 [Xanthocarpia ochracea]